MKIDDKLSSAFNRLAQRLFKLENEAGLDIREFYVPSHSIDDVLSGEILTSDLESAQDYLNYYLAQVHSLKDNLVSIVDRYPFPTMPPFDSYATDTKAEVIKNLNAEIAYYITMLNSLLTTVIEKHESLGVNRFSNAGFKIKLNLKVEAVGGFFNALFESGIINTKNPDSSISLTKKELAVFIQKNFSCTTSDNIGIESIKNSLSRKNADAEAEAIDRLFNFIKSPQQK